MAMVETGEGMAEKLPYLPMADAEKDEVRAALERAIGFQYEIIRLLGRGGMGAVYQAHERALDRPVAIKVLPPEVAGGTTARERFLREARTAARLTHPNIVPLFTFGEAAGLVYYVMGYVEGESLQQRLDRGGGLDSQRATRILDQLAGALEYAHTQGIVHRDVKPDNVLLERGTGDAKLTDFGIAKRATDGATLTGTGLLMGTPRYMSPEQASGDRDLDARSDIYALGLVGYAMLTGRPPFDGTNVQDVLRQQVTREAPSLRKALPDAPSALVVSIDKALAKDPKQRWQNARAMAAAITDEEGHETDTAKATRAPGVYAMTMIVITILFWNAAWYFAWRDKPGIAIPLALFPLAGTFDYLIARYIDKKSRTELWRMFTQPPRWWSFWWPERWRRADDVWSRLPADVREIRNIGSLGIGLGLFTLQWVLLSLSALGPQLLPIEWRLSFQFSLLFGLVGSLGLIALGAFKTWLWGRKHGLSADDAAQITSQPTARLRFWNRPEIANVLMPFSEAVEAGEPRTHADLIAAIASAVRELPEHREAADAARRIVDVIDGLDVEIVRLGREAEPGEVARLEKKLETPGNDEMRKLYASQLELLRRLDQQRLDAEARRSRYSELLRTLWLQVASLRAQMAADNAQVTEVSGRIREICRSVQHDVEGAREAAAVLKP
jgi:hypothetical protein